MTVEPTTRPARARQRPSVSWRHALGALTASLLVIGGIASPVLADNGDTSWDDVVAAQGNVDRQQALIADIQSEIARIDARLASATVSATEAGNRYSSALSKSQEKAGEVAILQTQASEAQATADSSREQAGQLAASMANRGAGDPSLAIFMQPENADSLLYQLGTISKLSEQTNGIYNQAVAEQNTATALGEQAASALVELQALEATAKTEFDSAQSTQITLQAQKNAADQRRAELQAMLGPLMQQRDVTAADFAAGEQLRQQELERQNAERAAAAAAEQQRAYEEARAAAEAAGVTPPPAPQIPAGAPPVVVPENPATNPDGTLAEPDTGTATPKPTPTAPATPAPTAPAPAPTTAPSPSTPAEPAPSTPAEPSPSAPAPSTPAEPAPSTPAEPAPTTPAEPAPTTPPVTEPPAPVDPYVPPARPDIEVVPEPEPEPPVVAPEPPAEPAAPGVLAGYHRPVDGGYVTDDFGMRLHPILGYYRMHNGLDLGVASGTCGAWLYAVHSGVVTYSGWNGGYGNHVVIDIGGGVELTYSHIMNGGLNVYVGQWVNEGDVVAYAGTTGTSTGCHLHFEVKYYGQFIDPRTWLASAGISY